MLSISPSQGHPNRKRHNWLAYKLFDELLEQSIPLLNGTLYDLGCGETRYKEWLLQYVDRYVGVDWPDTLHDTKPDVIANLNEPLLIENDIADTVLCLSVLEHLSEPQTMLNEAYRILKPGRALILQVPWQWWIHEAPHDYFRYTPYGLRYMLHKAGFIDIVVEPRAGYFTTAILKWNYFTKRFVRGSKIKRWLITAILLPIWYIGQKIAPLLDKLDRHWALEASGFYVVARKP